MHYVSDRIGIAHIFREQRKLRLLPVQRFTVGVCDDHLLSEPRITRHDVWAVFGDRDENLLLGCQHELLRPMEIGMPTLLPKADMVQHDRAVRFVPQPDSCSAARKLQDYLVGNREAASCPNKSERGF